MDIITGLKSFIAVVDHRSFSRGSHHIYKSTATVSKQISWLEDYLGTELLVRSTRHLDLTDAGQTLYNQGKHILALVDETKNTVSKMTGVPSGPLHIFAPIRIYESYLADIVFAFQKQYPKVEIRLSSANLFTDFSSTEFDIIIHNEVISDQYMAEPLATLKRYVVGAPGYFEKQGKPKRAADLTSHNCLIINVYYPPNRWKISENTTIFVQGDFSSDNAQIIKKAALEGKGIMWASSDLYAKELADGKLVRILTEYEPTEQQLFMNFPKHQQHSLKSSLFRQFLKDAFIKRLNKELT